MMCDLWTKAMVRRSRPRRRNTHSLPHPPVIHCLCRRVADSPENLEQTKENR